MVREPSLDLRRRCPGQPPRDCRWTVGWPTADGRANDAGRLRGRSYGAGTGENEALDAGYLLTLDATAAPFGVGATPSDGRDTRGAPRALPGACSTTSAPSAVREHPRSRVGHGPPVGCRSRGRDRSVPPLASTRPGGRRRPDRSRRSRRAPVRPSRAPRAPWCSSRRARTSPGSITFATKGCAAPRSSGRRPGPADAGAGRGRRGRRARVCRDLDPGPHAGQPGRLGPEHDARRRVGRAGRAVPEPPVAIELDPPAVEEEPIALEALFEEIAAQRMALRGPQPANEVAPTPQRRRARTPRTEAPPTPTPRRQGARRRPPRNPRSSI